MKIQPAPCCSNAYGPHSSRARFVLLFAAAALLIAGVIATRTKSAGTTLIVRESIVVEAESPRAVVTKLADTYSVSASDMQKQVAVLVAGRDGNAIPLQQVHARASYASGGGLASAVALAPMNDHFMANIDPEKSGTLTVTLANDGLRQQIAFELPFSSSRRTTS